MRLLYLISFLFTVSVIGQNIDNYEFNDDHILNTHKINDYCLSSDMKYLAVYNATGIHIVDVASKTIMNTISTGVLKTGASKILFSPDNKNLIVALQEGEIQYYPLDNSKVTSYEKSKIKIISFDISNDGKLLSIIGIVPNRKKANRKLVNGVTGALEATALVGNQVSKKRTNPSSSYNRGKRKGFYDVDKVNALPDYTYAVQFIDVENPKNKSTIELKKVGYTDASDQGIYKYLILAGDKKSIQVQNRLGNVATIISSSSLGFPNKVDKKVTLTVKTEYETAGFNNPIAVEIYQKLGLYNYIESGYTATLKNSEDNIIGPRFSIINNVISNTDFSQNYVGYSSSKNNPRKQRETYLYTQGSNPENPNSSKVSIRSFFEDVDIAIPENPKKLSNKYALIIGNEHYTNFRNPSYAINDARIFKEYCNSTLNVPWSNIEYVEDGTTSVIKQKFYKISEILKKLGGEGELIFYYAGHMEVDQKGNKYILSTDSFDNEELKFEIKLSDFYNRIYAANNKRNLFFIDACYSGANRNNIKDKNSYTTSRGRPKVKYKNDVLRGNTVSFLSSSDLQKSYSSDVLKHGIFTYHLLLKIKQTKGKVTLRQLVNSLKKEVDITALKLAETSQTPDFDYNPELKFSWTSWKLSE